MRAKAVLRMMCFAVFLVLPAALAQEACSKDKLCEDPFCCMLATNECSSRPANSVCGGDMADDPCECLSDVLDEASGTCKECSNDNHCDYPFCCILATKDCSSRAAGSVARGKVADDQCECASHSRDPETGICGGCTMDKHCDDTFCCMVNDECSSRPAESVLGGEIADDLCECLSHALDEDTGTCKECSNDAHCEEPFCCILASNTCSSRPEGSVLGGDVADGLCECFSDAIDPNTGTCEECSNDDHCSGRGCCKADNTCSSQDQGSVQQGEAADDVCECVSGAINGDGICECVDDDECPGGDICGPEERLCRSARLTTLTDPTACGDPHMTGFHGQKFDFTGDDGQWYALLSDPRSMHINMRVTAPVPSMPVITYITGLSLITSDVDGIDHTVVVTVKDPHSLDSACPVNTYPCLADGSLNVVIDGEEVLAAPGTVAVGPGMQVTAVNIPGECRSFGFETYWERKKMEYAQSGRGRRLLTETLSMGEWVLADPTATNAVECSTYVSRAMSDEGGMFDHQSEHASFQIVTPTGAIRLSHGRLNQLAMRDPSDQFDLPDHLTWQMNIAVDRTDISHHAQGILGETIVPRFDANGIIIMHGMECIRGAEKGYSVRGPLGISFSQGGYNPF